MGQFRAYRVGPGTRPPTLLNLAQMLLVTSAVLGCGGPGVVPAGMPVGIILSGNVTIGGHAVAGSKVRLQVLVSGNSNAAPNYTTTAETDVAGSFRLTETVSCPSDESLVLIEAAGGQSVPASHQNTAIELITLLGTCGSLSSHPNIVVNEITTVGALWPLSAYVLPSTASADSSAFSQAVSTVNKLVNLADGSTPGTLAAGEIAPVEKINSLGGILAGCAATAGGTAGDGTPCGSLFAAVSSQNETVPQTTLEAALQIARNPTWNVGGIFSLPSLPSGQPMLASVPDDWTLPILTPPPTPTFSPGAGPLSSGQPVTIYDEAADAAIYYTLDGTLPTPTSSRYAAPISISTSTVIHAVAVRQSIQSAMIAAAYSVAVPVSLGLSPASVTLIASQSQLFQATTTGVSQNAVAYSLQPAFGSLTAGGLYTAPPLVNTATTVTITARTTDGSQKTVQSVINVVPGTMQLSVPDTFLTVGSSLTVTVTLSQPAPQGGSVVTLSSSDATVATVAAPTITVPAGQTSAGFLLAGQKAGSVSLSAAAPGFGMATKSASVNPPAITRSFMGLNVGDTVHRWPTFQLGTLMTTSRVQWAATNPSAGVFNFAVLDQYFEFAQQYGADIVFPLLDTPAWASSKPTAPGQDGAGTCAPPTNMTSWDDYVRAVATYAGPRIKYWTVGNEVQDRGYWCGDVPTLVMMVQHARTIIRSINPNAIILAPSTTSLPDGPNMLANFLAAGGGQYVDAVSFHGYNTSTAEDLLPVLAAYKQVLVKANLNLPLWDTEADWNGSGIHIVTDTTVQAAFVSKYFILHASQGIARFIWYAYDGGPWGGLVVDGGTYAETAASQAYAETYKWLVGASINQPCTNDSNGTWTCGIARPGGYTGSIMWNSTRNIQLSIPAGMAMNRDLSGTEHTLGTGSSLSIGTQPILLENKSLPQN